MKKLVLSLVALFVAVGVVGGGFAAFTDSASATNNVFQSGTLDLELSQDGSTWVENTTNVWVSPTTWAPGESFTDTLWLRDAGTIDIQSLTWKTSSYVQSSPSIDLGTQVILTSAWYDRNGNGTNDGGTEDILADLETAYAGVDGELTLRELHDAVSGANPGYEMEPGAEVLPAAFTGGKRLELTWQFDADADNTYQGQTVTVSFDFNASN